MYSMYYTCLWSVYFGRVSSWRFHWRAGSYFSCVGLRCVECRAGTIYLSASLEWMAGLFRFSLFWRCCSGCGTVEMVGGGLAFFHFLYFAVNSPGGRLSVVGFCSSILVFLGYNWHYTRCCML